MRGIIGLPATAPACRMIAGLLVLPGIPIVALLDHRDRLRRGLYAPEEWAEVRQSVRT